MTDDQTVWVASSPTPDGVYRVEVTCGPDVARVMDRAEALDYAAEVTLAGLRALHDAQLAKALRSTGLPEDAVAGFLLDLRRDRPALRAEATAPLVLAPGVAAADGAPFVRVAVQGLEDGQWPPGLCFTHAGHVLGCLAATELDQALLRQLRAYDIDEDTARNVVASLPDQAVDRHGEATRSLNLTGRHEAALREKLAAAMLAELRAAGFVDPPAVEDGDVTLTVHEVCARVALEVLGGD